MVQTLFQLCVLGSILTLGIYAMPAKPAMPDKPDMSPKYFTSSYGNLTCRDNGVLYSYDGGVGVICYVYVENLDSKDNQEDYCNNKYSYGQFGPFGYAAFSEDSFMNAFLQNYLKKVVKDPKQPLWLGADATSNYHCSFSGYCGGSGYYWSWQNEANVEYTNFAPGQNGTAGDSYGIAMIPESGLWIRANGKNSYATVCQFPPAYAKI